MQCCHVTSRHVTTASPLRKTESLVAWMIGIMSSEKKISKLFNALGKPTTGPHPHPHPRHDTNRGASGTMGEDQVFNLELAKVLTTVDWENSDGNPVSLSSNHKKHLPLPLPPPNGCSSGCLHVWVSECPVDVLQSVQYWA